MRRQVVFLYLIYGGACCSDIPRAQFVSFPIRVVVDAAFVERAVDAHGPDKKAATCKLVSEQFKKVAEFYKSTMNLEFHVEGRIIGPDEPGAPDIVTQNCRDQYWQNDTFGLFGTYMKELGGGNSTVFISGCKGIAYAYTSGGACAKESAYAVVPWGSKKFEWFILAHELGHMIGMADYKLNDTHYVPDFMMGMVYSCCTVEVCNCKPFTELQKSAACDTIKRGGTGCAKVSSVPHSCTEDLTAGPADHTTFAVVVLALACGCILIAVLCGWLSGESSGRENHLACQPPYRSSVSRHHCRSRDRNRRPRR